MSAPRMRRTYAEIIHWLSDLSSAQPAANQAALAEVLEQVRGADADEAQAIAAECREIAAHLLRRPAGYGHNVIPIWPALHRFAFGPPVARSRPATGEMK
ncbi:MAG: hypothetical protein EPN72_10840 [Nevskiaceae bacterium]|nr:MAG: hypothetical protein EPN63_05850 [Nevskiaceae bacterium]TBR72241.1 MAG: hypothetical protein EPN72_10840 [Nevskiaceae bacterium]